MESEQFKEIIEFARDKEREAVDFYMRCSELSMRSGMKKAFLEMADEEKKHVQLLENIQPEYIEKAKLKKIPNLKISDYLADGLFSADMSYQDLLISAMKREEKSYALYTALAVGKEEPKIQKLFQILAQEELKHKNRLEKEYDDVILMWN